MSSGSGLELLLHTLGSFKRTGEKRWPQWKALCPCHEDITPSLLIDYKPKKLYPEDGPTVLVDCKYEGCQANPLRANPRANLPDVCRALGLKTWDVLQGNDQWNEEVMGEPPPPARLPPHATLVAYCKRLLVMDEPLSYLTEVRKLSTDTIRRHLIGWDLRSKRYTFPIYSGSELVNVRRYKPNPAPDETKWLSLAGRSVEYLYPALPSTRTVLLCEGELDTLLARQHGLPAVGVMGVNIWSAEWIPAFAGGVVAICFDCDAAGRSAAVARRRELCAAGARVKVVDLGLADKEDLTDFFVRHKGTRTDLLSIIQRTPFSGNEALNGSRLRPRTEGKRKPRQLLQAPGLSSSPSGKEKTQQ